MKLDRGAVDAYSGNDSLLGMEYEFEDKAWGSSPASLRSGKMVRCRLVRNSSGFALLPGRLVVFSTTAGEHGSIIKGYARTTAAQQAFPVDEFCPTTGVPNDSMFYIVVKGPAMCKLALAPSANLAVGDRVVAVTAATTGATTAGRIDIIDLTGATGLLANQILNYVGVALTARTTGETGTNVLCDVGQW